MDGTNGMLLLLDLQYSAILECPLDDIGVWGCPLGCFALAQGRPEVAEVLELDEVPD